MNTPRHNRLANATSPYLLQHATNPVDWYPWGEEAQELALAQNKPIFLSVGYSSCHWCHVMAHESFEDEATAQILNEKFVNIKVDREERPDVDEIYMNAVQLFSGGHGGWPMSVFLTPDLVPFYAGTYFPPAPRHGLASFSQVLHMVADAYENRSEQVAETGQKVVQALRQMTQQEPGSQVPGAEVLRAAFETLKQSFDEKNGGFGRAPKFPHTMDISFLLRYALRYKSDEARNMALVSLHKMARGGMYDQLGGGFHRYSVDERWLIPHFEKMLYDNALLARSYLEGYQVSKDFELRRICEETLQYVQGEMTHAEGGFYSAQDADSEGVEGKYFVWTRTELNDVLGSEDAEVCAEYFDVRPAGNYEHGTSVLSRPRDDDVIAARLGIDLKELETILARCKSQLKQKRGERVAPGLDDKIIVAWNGLMISAFARAFQVLRREEYLKSAIGAAEFVDRRAIENGLFRTERAGRISGKGFLDDYTAMIGACLDLYECTFEPRWLDRAQAWNRFVLEEFDDREGGGFYYSGSQHEALITRTRNALDNATPSGNSMAIANLLRLATLTGDRALQERAEAALRSSDKMLRHYPSALGELLCAVDYHMGPRAEIVLSSKRPPASEPLHAATFAEFSPRKVVAGWPAAGPPAALDLLGERDPADTARAYVCQQFTCREPIEDPAGLSAEMQRTSSGTSP